MKSTICDKCKRAIMQEVTEVKFKEKDYDLCWECSASLLKFLQTKPNILSKFIK